MQRTESVLPHQASDSVLTARLASFTHIEEHERRLEMPRLALNDARMSRRIRASSTARADCVHFNHWLYPLGATPSFRHMTFVDGETAADDP